jgi:methyl-accepting chemotaxis protein
MTIRAKLYAAIAMTVLGPVVTIAVALSGMDALGDRFAEVSDRAARQALALELKFQVTDLNGWQTAYGYDDGRSRPAFERAAESTKGLLEAAGGELTAPRERALLDELGTAFDAFMRLDADAWRALQAGRRDETKRILLGPELRHFATMARAADALADEQNRRAAAAEREFRDARRTARRELVAVGIGAGVVIVLLLLTVQDVVRLALERRLT